MPPESRKATSKNTLAARARMMVTSNLGWLEGFPLEVGDGGVRWMTVPAHGPSREITVERRHLSRATFTLNKLRDELAPALPRLAEDPDLWMASVERRVELLKLPVHQGAPVPRHLFGEPFFPRVFRDQASRLSNGEPRLRSLLDALSWIHAGHPENAREALDLAVEWSPGLEALAARLGELPVIVTLIRLIGLAADQGRERVRPLAACVLDERTHDTALEGGEEIGKQLLKSLDKQALAPLPELPAGSLGRDLAAWCEELVQQSRGARQRVLQLFALATPLRLVESWARWWAETRRLLRAAGEARALPYHKETWNRLRARVEALRKACPPELRTDRLMTRLRQHMTGETLVPTGPLARVLARLPDEPTETGRALMFGHWHRFSGYTASRLEMMIAGFERYLGQGAGDPQWLRPWAGWDPGSIDMEAVGHDPDPPRRMVLAAYDFLAEISRRHGPLESDAAARAVMLFRRAKDPDLAGRLFDSIHAEERYEDDLSSDMDELAVRICRDRPESFADVLEGLEDQRGRWDIPPTDWPESLLGPLTSGVLGELTCEAIITGQLDRLVACGGKALLLEAAGDPLPLPVLGEPAAPGWVERYPPQLHPALCRLAVLLDDAEARVARWLKDDLPESWRLEREIQGIELRLPEADEERRSALLIRLQNLRDRLERPEAPGPARLERLTAKLERAWGRAVLERWEREMDVRLSRVLPGMLGIGEVPSWLTEPGPLSLLAAASRLPTLERRLAYRLFALRCGPPPWDLRDAPENRRFVESLPHLDWSSWIDGVGTVEIEARSRRLRLALEDDPLEIFRMGAHFQTCLRPEGINYASVFANTADINKRVLYLRDEDGRVLGRCLLALTARGEILTFADYCHDSSLGFEGIAARFADQLAGRMGTRRVARGPVPVLVAPGWYDDGAYDLGAHYPALEEGSPLRERLASVAVGEVVDELRRALQPAGLDEANPAAGADDARDPPAAGAGRPPAAPGGGPAGVDPGRVARHCGPSRHGGRRHGPGPPSPAAGPDGDRPEGAFQLLDPFPVSGAFRPSRSLEAPVPAPPEPQAPPRPGLAGRKRRRPPGARRRRPRGPPPSAAGAGAVDAPRPRPPGGCQRRPARTGAGGAGISQDTVTRTAGRYGGPAAFPRGTQRFPPWKPSGSQGKPARSRVKRTRSPGKSRRSPGKPAIPWD